MNINDFYENRNDYFLKMSASGRNKVIIGLVIGVAAFAAGLLMGNPTRAWGALLFNTLFFYTLALGGTALGVMQDVVGAVWGRPIRRIHEAFSAFLLPATIILIFILVAVKLRLAGAGDVYAWIRDPQMLDHFAGKNVWLQEIPMIIRNIGILIAIYLTARWQIKQSTERDLLLVSGNKDKAMEVGLLAKKKLRFFAAPCLIVYGFGMTFLYFDLTMSLEPLWFSTLWGGWFFSIMMHTLMASIMVMMFFFKNSSFGSFIKQKHFHDIGKMMHGFTAFFGYLTYAHILTYWYGNVPEETEYFIHRLHAPWIYLVYIILVLAFIAPMFIMIPKAAKWTKKIALPMALTILFAQWCTYYLVVMPSVTDLSKMYVPFIEVGMFAGILSLFIAMIYQFGGRVPMVTIADPMLPAAMHDHH